jgi:hypothetical protein
VTIHANPVVDRIPRVDALDWGRLDKLAPQLGPRSRGLIACRNADGLRVWAVRAAAIALTFHPDVASAYRELADIVLAPRFVAGLEVEDRAVS